MNNAVANRRLADLLLDPREDLDVEAKGWLDLVGDNEHKATLAKTLLALANHGGGFVLIGFEETPTGLVPVPVRPATLDAYTQDCVNGIVQSYAEPPFHCAVHHVKAPTGAVHPIIVVPGGHRVPIRAKRGGPGNATVQMHAIYIRRLGPQSEVPQSGAEWDALFGRCLMARREELLSNIRDLLLGETSDLRQTPAEGERLDRWTNACLARWNELVARLPEDDARRCPRGRYWFTYQLRGDFRRLSLRDFHDTLARSTVGHTGWPPWWVPTRPGIEPYVRDGTVECWLGRDDQGFTDAAHADFWRVSPEGFGFLLRGYQEDSPEVADRGFHPGEAFDLTLPIWRVGEALLTAERLASNIGGGSATMAFRARYAGLAGRQLVAIAGDRFLPEKRVSHEDAVSLETVVPVASISPNLVEVVHKLLSPLYELFSFFPLRIELVQTELSRLRRNRY
jgi:hypothetical protein